MNLFHKFYRVCPWIIFWNLLCYLYSTGWAKNVNPSFHSYGVSNTKYVGKTVVLWIFWCVLLLLHYIHLTAFFQDNPVSWHQKDKPFWILLEQEMMGWHWHQLDHMQIICTLGQTDNYAITSPLSFYRPDALPATQPTASKHWRQNDILMCSWKRICNQILFVVIRLNIL